MSKRAAGIGLIFISAFLYGIRYLSAGLFGSNVQSWNGGLFRAMLDSVGSGPTVLSVIALIVGIIYLIWSEVDEKIKKKN